MAIRITYKALYGNYTEVVTDMSVNYVTRASLFFQGKRSADVVDSEGVVHCLNPRFVYEITIESIED